MQVGEIAPTMSREEWQDWRKDKYGSSDIPAILGLSPYTTPLELWCQKTGKIERAPETPAMRYGTMVEPHIAALWQELHPEVRISKSQNSYSSQIEPKFIASPDFEVLELDRPALLEFLEIKHTATSKGWDDGSIPDYAHSQTIWQTGIAREQLPWIERSRLAALIQGRANDLRDEVVTFDQSLFDSIFERVLEFKSFVDRDIPPQVSGSDVKLIQKLYDEQRDQKALSVELVDAADLYAENGRLIKALEEEIKALEEEIKGLKNSSEEIKCKFLMQMKGSTSGVLPDGRIATAKLVTVKEHMRNESSYIKFSIKGAQGEV